MIQELTPLGWLALQAWAAMPSTMQAKLVAILVSAYRGCRQGQKQVRELEQELQVAAQASAAIASFIKIALAFIIHTFTTDVACLAFGSSAIIEEG